jgi:hypothetical protein
MRIRFYIHAFLVAALLVATMPARAFCGFYAGKADASLFNEASQVVVARDGKRTVISMLNDYRGPLSDFVLVVPTPVALQQGQVRIADKAVFEHLDSYSSPRLAEFYDNDPCVMEFRWGEVAYPPVPMEAPAMAMPMVSAPMARARDQALGVKVEARYTLEEYDIVSLSATQSAGLEIWLRENGYKIPKGASEALRPYINQGMKFFIAKVNLKEQAKNGYSTLRPLQFAFESEKFMLPMRLGMLNAAPGKPQDLIVYLMTKNGRVESSNYRTVKLPANVNLPDFVKPKFQDFYKAMFDYSTKSEDYRTVFTEYFWNMSWCDPCAAPPLSEEELTKAGVFWLGGNEAQNFNAMKNPKPAAPPAHFGGGVPVMLTRLHVRYTSQTFPEDLMFTQTGDTENWQARYVIQNPYGGSIAECAQRVNAMNCDNMCRDRVSTIVSMLNGNTWGVEEYRGKNRRELSQDCSAMCRQSKQNGLDLAMQYYKTELPQRVAGEKRTLAQLTGWSMHDIDAIPGARRYALENATDANNVAAVQPWWRRLFDRQ